MHWQNNSLEGFWKRQCLLLILVQISLLTLCWRYGFSQPHPIFNTVTISCLITWLGATVWIFHRVTTQVKSSYLRSTTQLECCRQQDFSQQAKARFTNGVIGDFHHQLNLLSNDLLTTKSNEDKESILLLRLVKQLNTPILVFDERLQLSFGNQACTTLFNQPWQTLRFTSAVRLGLGNQPEWHFKDEKRQQRWQVRHSNFNHNSHTYHLLVMTDIQIALREQELKAWQRLIRVISHEIRNSLTPVSTMLERLKHRASNERDSAAFDVIVERCEHLAEFVKRYAQLQQSVTVKATVQPFSQLCLEMSALFPQANWQLEGQHLTLHCDVTLLKQVLINLTKNALEACSDTPQLTLSLKLKNHTATICLTDNGHGLINPDNLFVPFYSTKERGEGIGLMLCQHLTEQMNGQLQLVNRADGQRGASAVITLVQPTH
ncbi:GHKL domain-containing protein [Pseudoalteromonas luteoviolacea]|uniref:sensor histidine kinase n=1 Tax=Pseudoalteromonas luteoviolacea TaxID=43657 RepID=UPI001B375C4A|nr:ATP-binding protein [Pseudoalteromonas luteoviolacea]MBQ4813357.1 GHKL domain-containing protein [Pseudoalteromonas luteoviolacea]